MIITARPFSVSATVAFISIFGIAVIDDVPLSFYIRALRDQGHPFVEPTILGSGRRLRAMMVTTATVDGVGSAPCCDLDENRLAQSQRPMAIVAIGGCVAIALLTRCFRRFDLAHHRDFRCADKATRPLVET